MTVAYLAIDPGDTSGVAAFDPSGTFMWMRKIKGHDELLDFLEDLLVNEKPKFVIERYRVRTHGKSQFVNSFSTVPTLQLIGAIKRIARKKRVEIHEQDPSPALAIGLKFLGLGDTYKGKHVPDDVSALAHGTYFIRKNVK